MDVLMDIHVVVQIKPNMLQMNMEQNIIDIVKDKYVGNITSGVYILSIKTVGCLEMGKVLNDGSVNYSITFNANVINPNEGDTYDLEITNSNKMGCVHKQDKLTIFIPKHYCIDEEIPKEASVCKVFIMGKRIEDSIVCIGKIIQ